ncbi:four helix bundle protein [Marinifilum sp.]|uniref:four helix bundle protein n=1 Tax=Marinifilum sp. TaxID=2033137 RepID=UPI003BAA64E0
MHNFKDLIVWRKARVLVKEIYSITVLLTDTEKFGLVSQMQRAAVSIPSNIAEGCGRKTNTKMARFLDIANGSSFELESLLILCIDLKFVQEVNCNVAFHLNTEIQRMIHALKQNFN